IRDFHVTGVQTCALPIFAILLITVMLVGLWGHFWTTIVTIAWWPLFIEAWTFVLQVSLAYLWYYTWDPLRAFKGVHMAIGGLLRSEERRVGKECRCRWAQ